MPMKTMVRSTASSDSVPLSWKTRKLSGGASSAPAV